MSNINRKFLFKWIPLIQAERMIENKEITEEIFEEKLTRYITKTIDKVKRIG